MDEKEVSQMKKLSIITTLYNSAKYLPKCLDSLLDQDIPQSEYEIIVVNDGSPDNSEEIAQHYAEKNGNIRVISQSNKGLAGARNTGIRASEGKYLYFVDPDDYILENSLSIILRRMEDESLDILRFGYIEVDEEYRPTTSVKHFSEPDYSSKVMDGYSFMAERLGIACYVWTYLFRSALIKDNSIFFIEGQYFDDTPWLPRVMAKAKRVDSIDFKRHFYLIRSNSLVQARDRRSLQKKADGEVFLIKELSRQRDQVDDANGKKWYGMIISHCVLTLVNYMARFEKPMRTYYERELKQNGIFPLSVYRATRRNAVKLRMINLSLSVYINILQMLSLIKAQ